MRARGREFAADLTAGDVVVLTGPLGAGKTTWVQGLADGLGVRGPITSPTFVIARVHPSLADGPALVHVDAYRVGTAWEFEDLGLDADLARAVTVVEWGESVVSALTDQWWEVTIDRSAVGSDETGPRAIVARWHGTHTD